jgi:ATP-dependent protease ClpP protease subunit
MQNKVMKQTINARSSQNYNDSMEYNVSYFPNKSGVYKIEIDSAIESVSQFSTAIQVLDNAKEDDSVEIHLSCCPGGSVDAGDVFLHSMMKCVAPIHVVAGGGTHSMATHILLAADSFELSDGFNACLHAGYDGSGGTVAEYNTKSLFDFNFRTKKFRESYKYFLSEAEIDRMLDGKDIWLDAEMWCERAIHRMECQKAEWEAEQEALKEIAEEKPKRVRKPLNLAPTL